MMGSVVGSGPEVREVLWYQAIALADKGFYAPPGRIGSVPKLGNVVYDDSYFCVMVT